MDKNIIILFFILTFGFSANSQPTLKEERINAQTLSPLRASVNKVGDRFTLVVLSPNRYRDCMVEGEITESVTKGKSGGNSKLSFAFDKMALTNGAVVTIQADLLQMANSKGKVGVDDDGQVIDGRSFQKDAEGKEEGKRGGNVFSRFGKSVARGAKGLALKIAGGMTIAFTSQGSDIHFEPGSVFTLSVSSVSAQANPKTNKTKTIESP